MNLLFLGKCSAANDKDESVNVDEGILTSVKHTLSYFSSKLLLFFLTDYLDENLPAENVNESIRNADQGTLVRNTTNLFLFESYIKSFFL